MTVGIISAHAVIVPNAFFFLPNGFTLYALCKTDERASNYNLRNFIMRMRTNGLGAALDDKTLIKDRYDNGAAIPDLQLVFDYTPEHREKMTEKVETFGVFPDIYEMAQHLYVPKNNTKFRECIEESACREQVYEALGDYRRSFGMLQSTRLSAVVEILNQKYREQAKIHYYNTVTEHKLHFGPGIQNNNEFKTFFENKENKNEFTNYLKTNLNVHYVLQACRQIPLGMKTCKWCTEDEAAFLDAMVKEVKIDKDKVGVFVFDVLVRKLGLTTERNAWVIKHRPLSVSSLHQATARR